MRRLVHKLRGDAVRVRLIGIADLDSGPVPFTASAWRGPEPDISRSIERFKLRDDLLAFGSFAEVACLDKV